MTTQDEYEAVLAQATALGVKVVPKTSWFWRTLAWLVMVVTFGKNKVFLTDYITTIFKTIGVPPSWNAMPWEMKTEILTHELIHVKQARKFLYVFFPIFYLLLPLPIGLAWFRYYFEREAYVAGFAVAMRHNPGIRPFLIDQVVSEMTGSGYAWTWPFPKSVRAWFEKNVPNV